MVAKVIIGLGLALLFISQAASSHLCPTCGLTSGSDACGCQASVVRPVRPQRIQHAGPRVVCTKIPGVERLRPIGDACSCGASIVSPAYVPKQRCSSCQSRLQQAIESSVPYGYSSGGYSSGLLQAPSALNSFEPEETGGEYEYSNSGYNSGYSSGSSSSNYIQDDYNYYGPQQPIAPADAVSLTLAYGLQQQAARSVPEERLAFGFRTIPKDSPIQKKINDIPEERLYTVDRQIVELKPVPRGYGCGSATLEQEAVEDLLQQQQDELELQDEGVNAGQAYLSYRDIGYVPERAKSSPQFIVNTGINEANYDEISGSRTVCNDGYIPGNVINTNSAVEYLEEADVSDAYGSDEDDIESPYSIIGSNYRSSNYGSSGSSYGSSGNSYGSSGNSYGSSGSSYGSSSYGSGYGSSSSYSNSGYGLSGYGSGNSGILVQRLSGGCGSH